MSEGDTVVRMSAFERLGGAPVVRSIVDRFYDLMEQDPRFLALREMHAEDLDPMRRSLAGFLTGWLGGPRDWFLENPGKCMMSLHGNIAVSRVTSRQWVEAMRLAIAGAAEEEPEFGDPDLGRQMGDALAGMAMAMVRAEPVGG